MHGCRCRASVGACLMDLKNSSQANRSQSELNPVIKPSSSSRFLEYTWHLDIRSATNSDILHLTESVSTSSSLLSVD